MGYRTAAVGLDGELKDFRKPWSQSLVMFSGELMCVCAVPAAAAAAAAAAWQTPARGPLVARGSSPATDHRCLLIVCFRRRAANKGSREAVVPAVPDALPCCPHVHAFVYWYHCGRNLVTLDSESLCTWLHSHPRA